MGTLDILAFAWQPSIWELLIILVIALLLFGKRLPEVARSLGKGVVEFKKGLKGVEEDAEQSNYSPPRSYSPPPPPSDATPASTSTENSNTPKS